eukprot:TRINITY_DN3703_c0_g1_i25.p1 TRINITY_DN3703_c0_g1~~TRINITY_DN3703_c0_g1_i25.p1  ORF type:complete len:327 (-),score=45.33 TRINITY_DN3703_c0_g1_i25:257-1237(-)
MVVCIQLWSAFRVIYYYVSNSEHVTGAVYGLGTFLSISLCFLLPYNLNKGKNTYLINTIHFVVTNKAVAFNWLCIAYGIFFVCLMVPQLVYLGLVQAPFIHNSVVSTGNFFGETSVTRQEVDSFFIILGQVLNLLTFNVTLLYLSMAAHLQSFQINSLLKENLSDNTSFLLPSHLKPVVHSVVQSLSDGNQSVEQLNTVVVFIFLLHLTSIATSLIYFHLWEVDGLVPIFLILLQLYFFLLPPAYISRCWDRVMEKILTLHALAPSKETELGSIILYMSNTYEGYCVSNIRIDISRVLHITYLFLCVFVVKVNVEHLALPIIFPLS